jgi:hypothetical protein
MSIAAKGGFVVSPGYNTEQHAHAQKKEMFRGQAEGSGEGGFGGLPRLRQSDLTNIKTIVINMRFL